MSPGGKKPTSVRPMSAPLPACGQERSWEILASRRVLAPGSAKSGAIVSSGLGGRIYGLWSRFFFPTNCVSLDKSLSFPISEIRRWIEWPLSLSSVFDSKSSSLSWQSLESKLAYFLSLFSVSWTKSSFGLGSGISNNLPLFGSDSCLIRSQFLGLVRQCCQEVRSSDTSVRLPRNLI